MAKPEIAYIKASLERDFKRQREYLDSVISHKEDDLSKRSNLTAKYAKEAEGILERFKAQREELEQDYNGAIELIKKLEG